MCAREFPALNATYREYEGKGVHFLALSLEPDPDLVRHGAEKLGVQLPVAVATDEVLGPLGVRNVPSTVIVNEKGIITGAATGARKQRFFEKRAAELLGD